MQKTSQTFDLYVFDTIEEKFGRRMVLTNDMEKLYSCLRIDDQFFVKCFDIQQWSLAKFKGCVPDITKHMTVPETTFAIFFHSNGTSEIAQSTEDNILNCDQSVDVSKQCHRLSVTRQSE